MFVQGAISFTEAYFHSQQITGAAFHSHLASGSTHRAASHILTSRPNPPADYHLPFLLVR